MTGFPPRAIPPDDSFSDFFNTATCGFRPYDWQVLVARDGLPDVLPVPTGLGKTGVARVMGVLSNPLWP